MNLSLDSLFLFHEYIDGILKLDFILFLNLNIKVSIIAEVVSVDSLGGVFRVHLGVKFGSFSFKILLRRVFDLNHFIGTDLDILLSRLGFAGVANLSVA